MVTIAEKFHFTCEKDVTEFVKEKGNLWKEKDMFFLAPSGKMILWKDAEKFLNKKNIMRYLQFPYLAKMPSLDEMYEMAFQDFEGEGEAWEKEYYASLFLEKLNILYGIFSAPCFTGNSFTSVCEETAFYIRNGKLIKCFLPDDQPAIVVPEGVSEIGPGAFYEYCKLVSLVLPHSLERVHTWAVKCVPTFNAFYVFETTSDVHFDSHPFMDGLFSPVSPFASCHVVVPEEYVKQKNNRSKDGRTEFHVCIDEIVESCIKEMEAREDSIDSEVPYEMECMYYQERKFREALPYLISRCSDPERALALLYQSMLAYPRCWNRKVRGVDFKEILMIAGSGCQFNFRFAVLDHELIRMERMGWQSTFSIPVSIKRIRPNAMDSEERNFCYEINSWILDWEDATIPIRFERLVDQRYQEDYSDPYDEEDKQLALAHSRMHDGCAQAGAALKAFWQSKENKVARERYWPGYQSVESEAEIIFLELEPISDPENERFLELAGEIVERSREDGFLLAFMGNKNQQKVVSEGIWPTKLEAVRSFVNAAWQFLTGEDKENTTYYGMKRHYILLFLERFLLTTLWGSTDYFERSAIDLYAKLAYGIPEERKGGFFCRGMADALGDVFGSVSPYIIHDEKLLRVYDKPEEIVNRYELPDGIKEICTGAICNMRNVMHLVLPPSVRVVRTGAIQYQLPDDKHLGLIEVSSPETQLERDIIIVNSEAAGPFDSFYTCIKPWEAGKDLRGAIEEFVDKYKDWYDYNLWNDRKDELKRYLTSIIDMVEYGKYNYGDSDELLLKYTDAMMWFPRNMLGWNYSYYLRNLLDQVWERKLVIPYLTRESFCSEIFRKMTGSKERLTIGQIHLLWCVCNNGFDDAEVKRDLLRLPVDLVKEFLESDQSEYVLSAGWDEETGEMLYEDIYCTYGSKSGKRDIPQIKQCLDELFHFFGLIS